MPHAFSLLFPLIKDLKDLLKSFEKEPDIISLEQQENLKKSLRKIEESLTSFSEKDGREVQESATSLLEELGSLKAHIEKQLLSASATKKGLAQYTKIKKTITTHKE